MPLIKTKQVLCDICGLEIKGDYLEVRYSVGVTAWSCFYIHPPKPEPTITSCGNDTLDALKRLFPHSEHR